MARQSESHVSEWASLLGEHVSEEALESRRQDHRFDGSDRPSGR